MSKEEDGGPAFPAADKGYWEQGEQLTRHASYGMSLRDWYAGMALQGFLSNKVVAETWSYADMAEFSYRAADAMIRVRASQGECR